MKNTFSFTEKVKNLRFLRDRLVVIGRTSFYDSEEF